MATGDRERWNERYAGDDWPQSPVPRLVALEALIRPDEPALALDLACGTGRHALYLAELGYTVDAWDVSDIGLAHLQRRARELRVADRVHAQQVDLDTVELPAERYDLVLDTYFLDRRLFGAMAAALKPGALLFLETLLSTQERPGRPDFYLQSGELRTAFPDLREVFCEVNAQEGWAALLARRPR